MKVEGKDLMGWRKAVLSIFACGLALMASSCAFWLPVRMDLPDQPIAEIPRELRGVRVSLFSWTHVDADTMKERIESVMLRAGNARFNAVFFQVRGQAEALYPSPIEPWSKLVGGKDPGFDPLAYAIEVAHRGGLEIHAYVNLLSLWNEDTPPADPEHLYHRRGPRVDADSSWVCFGEDGRPMARDYYLNPALPQVKSYLKRVVRHLVESYDLDGIHFDRVRYPGAAYLNDPYSLAQFAADGAVSSIARGDWARERLTDLVEDVVAEALLVKPYLAISAVTWGLYRSADISGYEPFKSGYVEYYQDAIGWLDRGIIDFIVPKIYWDIPEPPPNFHDLWTDFQKRTPNHRYIIPGMRVRQEWLASGETVSQVHLVRSTGGVGHIIDGRAVRSEKDADIVRRILYPNRVPVADLKRIRASQVVGLDVSGLEEDNAGGRRVRLVSQPQAKTADADGRFGLILAKRPDTLHVSVGDRIFNLATQDWRTPYRYQVEPDGAVTRKSPWVELRRSPQDTTNAEDYHFLFKTGYPARAFVNGDSVKVYRTGVFFDSLGLEEGVNRVRAEVLLPDSSRALYEREFVRVSRAPKSPFPLWIEPHSVEPQRDLVMLPEDVVRLSFRGSKGQRASARLRPGKVVVPFAREDGDDYSVYRADLPLRKLKRGKSHSIEIVLESAEDAPLEEKHKLKLKTTVEARELDEFPLARTIRAESPLSYSMGQVRLGGPYIAEYDSGVVLQTSGKIGDAYRVRLSRDAIGYIRSRVVVELPDEGVRPGYHIRWLHAAVSDSGDADVVRIPYPEPVPYAVIPDPDRQQILVSLYGVKSSSTWVQHRSGLRFVDKLTWRQTAPETYQVVVNLKTERIWGYDIRPEKGSLVLRLRYPPVVGNEDGSLPLAGLKIAIEAGHGGSNTGAVGLSGLLEKDINLDTALKLGRLCRASGMEVFQLRPADDGIPYMARRDSIEASGAHLHVSIHANAGGGGYLRTGGTSTYYHNPFWAQFATNVYDRLLELDLDEFGVIGSFNYRITRISSRPAILVETAFTSHAEDEERLADPEFRTRIAEKIFAGIVDYVKQMLSGSGRDDGHL